MKLPSLLVLVFVGASTIGATPASLPAATIGRVPVATPGIEHRFFGLLQSVRGTAIVLRLRTGRLLLVDATEAFALTHVSEPLFTGKPTVVEGLLATNGVLHADLVKRAARPGQWANDR